MTASGTVKLAHLLESLPPAPSVTSDSRSGRSPLTSGVRLLDGGYTIYEEIGCGSFGLIYAGTEARVGQDLAVKEFFPKGFRRIEADRFRLSAPEGWTPAEVNLLKKQFREEYQVLERFERPGIVKVYELFEEDGGLFMVMERLRGATLDEILQCHGSLTERDALAVIRKLVTTLQMIHLSGLVHGDIKPENLFLTFDSEVILLDFGAVNHYLTHNRQAPRFLTPGYAPPEQYQSHKAPDPASDIYALGATFYELLTGQPPPDAVERLRGKKLPSPSRMGAKVSSETVAALAKTLALTPEKRPASAPELANLFPEDDNPQDEDDGILTRLPEWLGHSQGIVKLELTSDLKFLASADRGGQVRLWTLQEDRCLGVLDFGQEIVALSIQPGDSAMAIAFRGGWVELVELGSGQGIGCVREGKPPVSSLSFSPDGSQLACGLSSGQIEIWNLKNGRLNLDLKAHEGPINQLEFSPSGRLLAMASNDRKVSVWDLKSHRRIRLFEEHRRPVQTVSFCSKGQFLLTGGSDMVLRLYDVRHGDEFRRLRGHEAMVWDVLFFEDLARAFTCSSDRTLRVWDTRNFRELARVQAGDGWLQTLAFDRQRSRLYSAGADSTIYRFQVHGEESVF